MQTILKQSLTIAAVIITCLAILASTQAMTISTSVAKTPESVKESQGAKIVHFHSLWWITDKTQSGSYDAYYEIAHNLNSAILSRNPLLERYYGIHFVNPYNNTIWVRLKHANMTIENKVLEIMRPTSDVKVIFLDCNATNVELKSYADFIISSNIGLHEKGIDLGSIAITENATLLVGIKGLTEEKFTLFQNLVKQDVDLEIIRVFNETIPQTPMVGNSTKGVG